ncbi:hypothetical protein TrispH2_011710 [Trichoplax sp. H2]|nr:hypothetical protein TrispH2_011710 [Trichoplax sp. H2]|eukprot:RDD36770.1 hypothetical protein TrispH2_011710 [Trichoplax sp. H2]
MAPCRFGRVKLKDTMTFLAITDPLNALLVTSRYTLQLAIKGFPYQLTTNANNIYTNFKLLFRVTDVCN